jgi:hypothetical protein
MKIISTIIVLATLSLVLLISTIVFAVLAKKNDDDDKNSSIIPFVPCQTEEFGSLIIDGVILQDDEPIIGTIKSENDIESYVLKMEESIDGNFLITSKKLTSKQIEYSIKRNTTKTISSMFMKEGFTPVNFIINMMQISVLKDSKSFNVLVPTWTPIASQSERSIACITMPSINQPALFDTTSIVTDSIANGVTSKNVYTSDGRAMYATYTGFGSSGNLNVFKASDRNGTSFEKINIITTIETAVAVPRQLLSGTSGKFSAICLVSRTTFGTSSIFLYVSSDGFITYQTKQIRTGIQSAQGSASMIILSTGEVQIFVLKASINGVISNFFSPDFETEFGDLPDISVLGLETNFGVFGPLMQAGLFENDVIGILYLREVGSTSGPSPAKNRFITNEDNYQTSKQLDIVIPIEQIPNPPPTIDFIFLPNGERRIYIALKTISFYMKYTKIFDLWRQVNVFSSVSPIRTFISTKQISTNDPCAVVVYGPNESSITHVVEGSLSRHKLNYSIISTKNNGSI